MRDFLNKEIFSEMEFEFDDLEWGDYEDPTYDLEPLEVEFELEPRLN
jgi:hypothetical protein